MYENSEGYRDPTAGMAISRMMKDYRKNRKDEWRHRYELKNRLKVYVASPYAGDAERNTAAAISYCRYVIKNGRMPVASHLMYPQVLNDSDPDEREMGTMFGLALLALCDEVWVFGPRVTPGMKQEIREAARLNIPVRYIKEVGA